jgi:hypothetical protein
VPLSKQNDEISAFDVTTRNSRRMAPRCVFLEGRSEEPNWDFRVGAGKSRLYQSPKGLPILCVSCSTGELAVFQKLLAVAAGMATSISSTFSAAVSFDE